MWVAAFFCHCVCFVKLQWFELSGPPYITLHNLRCIIFHKLSIWFVSKILICIVINKWSQVGVLNILLFLSECAAERITQRVRVQKEQDLYHMWVVSAVPTHSASSSNQNSRFSTNPKHMGPVRPHPPLPSPISLFKELSSTIHTKIITSTNNMSSHCCQFTVWSSNHLCFLQIQKNDIKQKNNNISTRDGEYEFISEGRTWVCDVSLRHAVHSTCMRASYHVNSCACNILLHFHRLFSKSILSLVTLPLSSCLFTRYCKKKKENPQEN